MQPRLLSILRCPVTGEELDMEVIEEIEVARLSVATSEISPGDPDEKKREIMMGWLVAQKSGYRYPIIDGVARLLADTRLQSSTVLTDSISRPDAALSVEYRQTVEHFRTQWKIMRTKKECSVETWTRLGSILDTLCPPEVSAEKLVGQLVLDAGCGHGKYLDALSARGIEVVGIDITPEVGRVFRKLSRRPNAHVIQANVLHPPFAPNTFDFVYSNGVIHHTPDTRSCVPLDCKASASWRLPFCVALPVSLADLRRGFTVSARYNDAYAQVVTSAAVLRAGTFTFSARLGASQKPRCATLLGESAHKWFTDFSDRSIKRTTLRARLAVVSRRGLCAALDRTPIL